MRIGLLVMILLGALSVRADGYLKYVREVFPVDKETVFYMGSQFGKITLLQWRKDSIVVEATFRVKQAEEWEKEGLSEQLGLYSEKWPGTVKVETKIDREFDREGELEVEMTVYVPEYIVMDLVNRHGTIRVPYFDSGQSVSLTAIYGDINVETMRTAPGKEIRLNVSYGKLNIEQCDKARIKSAYSSVGVGKARYLDIRAEKSKISVQATDSLVSEGSYNVYDVK